MREAMLVRGATADAFTPVRDMLAQVAAAEPGLSAQLCIYHRGALVADLWTGSGMAADSLTAAYSCSKGAAYLVIALLIQDGLVDPYAPVITYWPELVAARDGTLTVADLLGHRVGLIGVDGGFSPAEVADDARIVARLSSQEPYWQPGSAHGYHALTSGALAAEIARRVAGSSLQEIFESRIRAPFDIDFYLGLPEEEDHRYLPVQPPMDVTAPVLPDPGSLGAIALNMNARPPSDIYAFPNERYVREKGQSSAGGIGSARGLARMYAAVIGLENCGPLLNEATIDIITTPQQSGLDRVFEVESRSLLGFGAVQDQYPSLSARAFGHAGATGSMALADPDNDLAYGYTRRRFRPESTETDADNAAIIAAMVASAQSM